MSLESTAIKQSTTHPTPMSNGIYDDGYLRVEHENYYVACGGQTLSLPRKEFLLFSRLTRNPERVVSAVELWQCAWGEANLNTESLHVHIYRLRRRLAPYGVQIETMVNVGYRLLVHRA